MKTRTLTLSMESFYGRFKTSTIGNRVLGDEAEARAVVFEYIEPFYNRYSFAALRALRQSLKYSKRSVFPFDSYERKIYNSLTSS